MNWRSFFHFLLAHHYKDEYNRCYNIGGIHLCARCSGLYPTLVITMIALYFYKLPIEIYGVFLFFFPIPPIVDWSFSILLGNRGINIIRTITGILAGVSVGTLLHFHIRDPFNIYTMGLIMFYSFSLPIVFFIRVLFKDKNYL